MSRGWYFLAGAAIIALAGQRFCAKEAVLTLPRTAAGWTLASPARCTTPVPPELQRWRGTNGARLVCAGDYTGPLPVTLTIYYMPSEFASAFDAAQKWQPQPGKMSFFKGSYFGVVESSGADGFTLERFVLAVESTLPSGSEWHH